tara:strand:- start:244 stop:969 length:726 start_codon:yes stop_codon:yes gene_type:complete
VTENPYNPADYPSFAVTVDIVILTVVDGILKILLIQRGQGPFRDAWALPGGFVLENEDLYNAALRELKEETNISGTRIHLEQLGTYGTPDRDPRMRVVTVAYWAVVPNLDEPKGGGDASHAEVIPVSEIEDGLIRLAFDHEIILIDAIERLRSKMEYTNVATNFFEDSFTVSDLRGAYEAAWDTELDAGNFQRKLQQLPDFLTPTGEKTKSESSGGRPADLFVPGPEENLSPPLKRNKPSE